MAPAILIVEDENIVAKDIAHALGDLGYEVSGTAKSSDDALRHVGERCPDLVLMDIGIKGQMDGIETAAVLRERYEIPVVYLTAYADEDTIGRAKSTQPLAYVLKPFKERELRAAVEIALHKHALERRLRDRQRWFATTLRSVGDAVVTVDPAARVTFVNRAGESLLGRTSHEVLGLPLAEVVPLVDEVSGASIGSAVFEALRERRLMTSPSRTALALATGLLPVEESAAPILSDDDVVLGAVLVLKDLTERRRLDQRLALLDRLSSLGTMAAGMAHELNNPLTSIAANVGFAMNELTGAQKSLTTLAETGDVSRAVLTSQLASMELTMEALRDACEGIRRAATFVSDLRIFSHPHPEVGSLGLIDVRAALDWALRIARPLISPHGRLLLSIGPLPLIRADETRLGQVFVNVLANAAQALRGRTSPGAAPPASPNEVRLEAWTDDCGRAVIEIADNGCGMSTAVLERIFEPFFTTKAPGEGTGLGLSISHGIITALGGSIDVTSTPDVGTTFRITVPSPSTPRSAPAPALDEAVVEVRKASLTGS